MAEAPLTDEQYAAMLAGAPMPAAAAPGAAAAPAAVPDRPLTAEEYNAIFPTAPPPATKPQTVSGLLANGWNKIVGGDWLPHTPPAVTSPLKAPDASEVVPPELADVPGYVPPKVVAQFGQQPGPVASGVIRGVRDVIDKPAEALAWLFGQGADTAAADAAARKAYDALPDNQKSTLARMAGQTAAFAPIAATGTGLLGEAGTALGSALPTLGRLGASWLGRLGANAAIGAGTGAGYGALTAKPGEAGQDAISNAEFGAVAGPVTSGVLAGTRAGWNALTGVTANVADNIADLARRAISYGIHPEASQLSRNLINRIGGEYLGSLPFSGRAGALEDNLTNWRRAVAATMGENSTTLGPTTMSAAAQRLSNTFENAAQNTNIYMDNALLTDLANVDHATQRYATSSGVKEATSSHINDIIDTFANSPSGAITGRQYLNLTQAGSPLQKALTSSDPEMRVNAAQIRSALDSALGRYAPADLQTELEQARGQWRAMKTVEDAVEAGGTGELEPSRLYQPALQHSRRFDASTGGLAYQSTELGDLGKIGSTFLAPQRSSGTAEKLTAIGAIGAIPEVAAGLYFAPVQTAAGLAGGAAGLAANRGLQSYIRSPWLVNRMITPPPALAPTRNALPYLLPGELAGRGLLGDSAR